MMLLIDKHTPTEGINKERSVVTSFGCDHR